MKVTHYRLPIPIHKNCITGFESRHPGTAIRIALIADLHDFPYRPICSELVRESPDVVVVAGDLTEKLTVPFNPDERPGLGFLNWSASRYPTYYAFGNHEIGASRRNLRQYSPDDRKQVTITEEWRQTIENSGAVFLDNDMVSFENGSVSIAGIGSALLTPDGLPDTSFLSRFEDMPGCKILICHHPEYFASSFRDSSIDFILSGHAHGGQWRLFGKGIWAPGQSFFPRYTSGVYEGRLIVSRGLSNTAKPIPRIFNPTEIVMIDVLSS